MAHREALRASEVAVLVWHDFVCGQTGGAEVGSFGSQQLLW